MNRKEKFIEIALVSVITAILLVTYLSDCTPSKKSTPSVIKDTTTGHWEYNDPNDGEQLVWVVDSSKTSPK